MTTRSMMRRELDACYERCGAVKMFAGAYVDFPRELQPPAGADAARILKESMGRWVVPGSLTLIARHLENTPGGYMKLLDVVGERFGKRCVKRTS